ncbi:hypothetical protein E2C01_067928 [Portunus trituberculatus]|uniref:Uncharacterized protein n=1 Tax=Portunus trituberculatus TaxID=210409 RepID=A0A5B7HUD6_PORTR|nr:hypothetical protein [Portunus trituberculatus]
MAHHHGLSEAHLQQLLAEETIDLIGNITFTEIYETAIDDPDAESHTSPPPPPYVSHDMKYPQQPEEQKIIECREDINHPSLSPIAKVLPPTVVAGPPSSPVAGPSGLSTSRGTAKQKLLPLMSTPLTTKQPRVMTQDDSDLDDIISDADNGEPTEFDTDDTPSDSDYEPPHALDTENEPTCIAHEFSTTDTEDEATCIAHDYSTTDNQGGDGNATPTAVNIVQVPESERRAHDKIYWSRTSLQRPTLLQPSAQYTPSLATPSARGAVTPLDFFELFFDEDMLNEIIQYTNIMIENHNHHQPLLYSHVSILMESLFHSSFLNN